MTDKKKPDIVENIDVNMADVLNLNIPDVTRLDVSSGYFELSGYNLVRNALHNAMKKGLQFRLLLGMDAITPPTLDTFEEYQEKSEIRSIRDEVNETELNQENMDAVSSLIALLSHKNMQVRSNDRKFNHSKCYILGSNLALVGSSNFTLSGFHGNHELNAAIYQPASLDKINKWFERMWKGSKDSKTEIIKLLEKSKFGIPPDPYEIHTKMLFEKYKSKLEAMAKADSSKITNLAKFQKDAVAMAMEIAECHRGVLIADSTGLGKTHVGLDIIRQERFDNDKKVLLIAPSQILNSVWKIKLEEAGIIIKMLTTESLGREDFGKEINRYAKFQTVVIDESQYFRSKHTNRRMNLMKLLSMGQRKNTILLSATPINNSIMDLYYQISIITNNDDSYFVGIGIPNLYEYIRKVANEGIDTGLEKIQQLLDQITVRRTRSFIEKVYPNEKLNGQMIEFPKREYKPIKYDLTDTIGRDVYSELLKTVKKLHMVPYGIEKYNDMLTDEEKKKHEVRAHLQVVLLLKRFESSTYAAKISIENKIRLYNHFQKMLKNNHIVRARDLNQIITKWNGQETDTDDPDAIDEFFITEITKLDTEPAKNYDVKKMQDDMSADLKILSEYKNKIDGIMGFDKKSEAVCEMIAHDDALTKTEKESGKVLIFTEYTATAKYLKEYLEGGKEKRFPKFPGKKIQLISGNVSSEARQKIIRQFAPKANSMEDEEQPEEAVDILISTEVLSEGQNLQDCNYVINYDLPWNPMRIVQRIGRIDRLTSKYGTVRSRECFPDASLDNLLKLVGNLIAKIGVIDKTIGMDAGILGEGANPKQFNSSTVTKLLAFAEKTDGKDVAAQQLERVADVMPSVSPLNEINQFVKKAGYDQMTRVPMGRRSGKKKSGSVVIVSYIQEKPVRRYYSVKYDCEKKHAKIIDDLEAFDITRCTKHTTKHLPMDDKNSGESFRQLLKIDKVAREIIKNRMNSDTNTANLLRRTQNKHSKNSDRIMSIVADSSEKISDEKANKVFGIIGATNINAWERDVENILKRYDIYGDVEKMTDGIIEMGKNIVTEKEVANTEESKASEMIMVGAMFVDSA